MEWSAGLLDLSREALQLMRAGGKIIVPIAAISLWMWFLILYKLMQLHSAGRERVISDRGLRKALQEQALQPQGWLAELLANFYEQRSHCREVDRQLLHSLLQKKAAELRKYIPTILVLASIAPLLGLLGTVTGMISTFDAISRIGTGNPRPLASGISEALITTQCGLAVAIPGLIMGTFLLRRAQRFQGRLEGLGMKLYRLCQSDPATPPNCAGQNEA